MDKVEEARKILKYIGMPTAQQADIYCYVLLAMAGIKPAMRWKQATNEWVRIYDIIHFINVNYGCTYSENTRETFRKQVLRNFKLSALIEDNGKSAYNPNYRWRLTDETLVMVKCFQSASWNAAIWRYKAYHDRLVDFCSSKENMTMLTVKINGADYRLFAGRRNELKKAIIEEFAPRFVPNAECLYIGDIIEKDLVKNIEKMAALGFEITIYDKMPDVVLYRKDKEWVYLVEAVTSIETLNPERMREIVKMTKNVTSKKIIVIAFWDFNTYQRFSRELAWEAEAWIAEEPDQMIYRDR